VYLFTFSSALLLTVLHSPFRELVRAMILALESTHHQLNQHLTTVSHHTLPPRLWQLRYWANAELSLSFAQGLLTPWCSAVPPTWELEYVWLPLDLPKNLLDTQYSNTTNKQFANSQEQNVKLDKLFLVHVLYMVHGHGNGARFKNKYSTL